jgi:D-alanyl-lipoteichoic acid acyltransferase DltB (MBOAT superfamily)
MSPCSLTFLFFCMAVILLDHLTGRTRLRQLILAAANATFLATFIPDGRTWIYFSAIVVGTYLALALVRLTHRGAVVVAGIALSVLLFLWFKRFTFVATVIPLPYEWNLDKHPVELVGLSYMLFKMIHMLVDEWQGQLAPFTLWSYLNYQLAFFTLTAGPIQRYNDFQRTWKDMSTGSADGRDAMQFWIRIVFGMLKIRVLGAWAEMEFTRAATPRVHRGLTDFLFAFYLYPFYLYMNFSGYTDVMIGAGGLLGFKVPENFNHPYLARNVLDFWDRWHISVTHWIRDYFFMASYKAAAMRFPRGARYIGYGLLFAALFLAGVWHGTTEAFVVFGVMNGLGAAATRIYGDLLRKRLGAKGLHAYLQNRLIGWAAVLVTLHYVALSMLFFSSGVGPALSLLSTGFERVLHLPSTLLTHGWRLRDAGILVTAAVLLVGLWKHDTIGGLAHRLDMFARQRAPALAALMCTATVVVVAIFFFDWAFQEIPAPVRYMAF